MNELLNKSVANLRNGNVYLTSISVEDVDECKSSARVCGMESRCLNTIGSYFCQCSKGYEEATAGPGLVCIDAVESETGFWSSIGLREILIGIALCAVFLLVIILAVFFVMHKISHKRLFNAYDTNLCDISVSNEPSPQPEVCEDEESLFGVPQKRITTTYVSFTKFQPIPEDPNEHELDCMEMSKPHGLRTKSSMETFNL
uniref:Uncharacterized LOC103177945 n=1 Tax=Callorhinchus milii TaxID=7868 RepID=A0A4W3GKC0_CALMI|eukprot:gi/632950118/ref/XP_007890544.1/ PREDICTED: uncharacterized protein LOC103177945 [Callorhinchus milii]